MSEPTDFGEPWVLADGKVMTRHAEAVVDVEVRVGRFEKIELDLDQVRRIIACVNFCRNIPTEVLEFMRWSDGSGWQAALDNPPPTAKTPT